MLVLVHKMKITHKKLNMQSSKMQNYIQDDANNV